MDENNRQLAIGSNPAARFSFVLQIESVFKIIWSVIFVIKNLIRFPVQFVYILKKLFLIKDFKIKVFTNIFNFFNYFFSIFSFVCHFFCFIIITMPRYFY